MARHRSRHNFNSWTNRLRNNLSLRAHASDIDSRRFGRSLRFEPLEHRTLLAAYSGSVVDVDYESVITLGESFAYTVEIENTGDETWIGSVADGIVSWGIDASQASWDPGSLTKYPVNAYGNVVSGEHKSLTGTLVPEVLPDTPGTYSLLITTYHQVDFFSYYGFDEASGSPETIEFTIEAPAIEQKVWIYAADQVASEGLGDAGEFVIQRTDANGVPLAADSPLTVYYTTGGDAVNGTDYQPLPLELTIPAGESSATIQIDPIADGVVESVETVKLTLADDPVYSIHEGFGEATVLIVDEYLVVVEASAPGTVEGGPTPGAFTVTRYPVSAAEPLTVQYTLGGTAINGTDYQNLDSSVTIPAGESSVTIQVDPIQDDTTEYMETVELKLSESSDYSVGSVSEATVEISDFLVSVESTASVASEQLQVPGVFLITRTGPDDLPLTVHYTTGGDAVNDDGVNDNPDYQFLPLEVTIPAGESSAIVQINSYNDGNPEPVETVELTLVENQVDHTYFVNANQARSEVYIVDNHLVTVEAYTPYAVEGSLTSGQFLVWRYPLSESDLLVTYSIGGTATNGEDYWTPPLSVTIPENESYAVATIAAKLDTEVDGGETVQLELNSGTDYSISSLLGDSATVTMDDPPAMTFGHARFDQGRAVVTDDDGNVYMVGRFELTVSLDFHDKETPGLESSGGSDIFVAKYSPVGELLWQKRMGGLGNDEAYGIDLGSDRSVYVTGAFSNAASFGTNDAGNDVSLTSYGDSDIFVCKLDTDGSFQWAKSMGGYHEDIARAIVVATETDAVGQQTDYVYTAGSFSFSADLYPRGQGLSGNPYPDTYWLPNDPSVPPAASGKSEAFISKLDSNGDFVWARAIGSSGDDTAYGIATDADGAVYATGSFSRNPVFYRGDGQFEPTGLVSSGDIDVFVCKLTAQGDLDWEKAIGGEADDSAYGIAVATELVNPENPGEGYETNVYTTGTFFSEEADFDPGAGEHKLRSRGVADVFVSKLAAEDGSFHGATHMGGSGYDGTQGNSFGYGITTTDGEVYLTGRMFGPPEFDDGQQPNSVAYPYRDPTALGDIFVAELNSDLQYQWLSVLGGQDDAWGYDITVSSDRTVYTTGFFKGSVRLASFDDTGRYQSAGEGDIFLSQIPQADPWSELEIDQVVEEGEDGRIVFKITVTNTGDQAVTGAQVTDLLPEGMAAESVSFSAVNCSSAFDDEYGIVTLYNIDLLKEETATLVFSGTTTKTVNFNTVDVSGSVVSNSAVVILGSDGDDTYDCSFGGRYKVVLNEVNEFEFDDSSADSVVFIGAGGNDTATLTGTVGDDTFVSNAGYAYATLFGEGFRSTIWNCETVQAVASLGDDVAKMYDSPGNDTFNGAPYFSELKVNGGGFSNSAIGFDNVQCFASDGSDEAVLQDSTGNDHFVAGTGDAFGGFWYGDGSWVHTKGFDEVRASASQGGVDQGKLYDSPDDDTFEAAPDYAEISGNGFLGRAESFERVSAFATAGGDDRAEFFDGAARDKFIGSSVESMMGDVTGEAFAQLYFNRVKYFEQVTAHATDGDYDRANLYDSPGDDTFDAYPQSATLSADGQSITVDNFDGVHAFCWAGGHDIANLYGSADNDEFYGTSVEASLYNPTFYNRAVQFDEVYAEAGEGDDDAFLFDSVLDDLLEADDVWAQLKYLGLNSLHKVSGFDDVKATATTGDDRKDIGVISFNLVLEGIWNDLP